MSGISIFDIIILAILVLFTLRGGIRGMASQIVSLVSLALAWIVATQLSDDLAAQLSLQAPWNRVLSMGLLFFGTWVGVWLLYRFISSTFGSPKLKEFDRQMGALFGFLKGTALCLLVTFFAVSMDWSRNAVYESKSGYYLTHLLDKVRAVMPEDIWKHVSAKLQQFGRAASDPAGNALLSQVENSNIDVIQTFNNTAKTLNDTAKAINAISGLSEAMQGNTQTESVQKLAARQSAAVPSDVPSIRPQKTAVPFSKSGESTERPVWNPRIWSDAIKESALD